MKHLHRSEQDRVIAGVCGGLAAHLNMDPLLFRLLFIVLTISAGIGITLYLLLWLVLPSAQQEYAHQEQIMRDNLTEMGTRVREMGSEARNSYARARRTGTTDDTMIILGAVLVGFGLLLLFRMIGLLVWMRYLWPVALVALGLAILWSNVKES